MTYTVVFFAIAGVKTRKIALITLKLKTIVIVVQWRKDEAKGGAALLAKLR